jgi:predicted MFS family arabinose efflux permease
VAGVLIALVGEELCFAIDAVSYLAVIASLLAMRLTPRPPQPPRRHVVHELREGLRYAAASPAIRSILLLLAVVSLMGVPYQVLMPLFATRLGGAAHTLGFLIASAGLGALVGALYLASRKSVLGLGRVIPLAAGTFGLGLVAFSLSRVTWLSMLILLWVGAGMMVQMAASNTLIQTIVDEDKRGRVMSFFAMAFFGTVPFGSLLAGSLAERLGAPATVLMGGCVTLAGALLFVRQLPGLRQHIRPIYVRLGILAEVAEGLQTAAQLSVPPED